MKKRTDEKPEFTSQWGLVDIPRMTQRKYSVSEINRMREGLAWQMALARGAGVFNQGDEDRRVELALQTHMLNGTDPSELDKWLDGTQGWRSGIAGAK